MSEGTIAKIVSARGYGFIAANGDKDLFFHSSELAGGLEFDEQLQGRRVVFDLATGPKGKRATNVRPAD